MLGRRRRRPRQPVLPDWRERAVGTTTVERSQVAPVSSLHAPVRCRPASTRYPRSCSAISLNALKLRSCSANVASTLALRAAVGGRSDFDGRVSLPVSVRGNASHIPAYRCCSQLAMLTCTERLRSMRSRASSVRIRGLSCCCHSYTEPGGLRVSTATRSVPQSGASRPTYLEPGGQGMVRHSAGGAARGIRVFVVISAANDQNKHMAASVATSVC